MIPFSEDMVLTGCEDGYARLVQFSPNRILSLAACHDASGDPSEILGLDVSHCGRILASISTDYCVQFHDISELGRPGFRLDGEDQGIEKIIEKIEKNPDSSEESEVEIIKP